MGSPEHAENRAVSPIKLKIATGGVPPPLQPFDNQNQQSAQQPEHSLLTPYPAHQVPQTPMPFTNLMNSTPRPIKKKEPLSLIYKITHKRLNIKLNPTSSNLLAQLVISLEL